MSSLGLHFRKFIICTCGLVGSMVATLEKELASSSIVPWTSALVG